MRQTEKEEQAMSVLDLSFEKQEQDNSQLKSDNAWLANKLN